MVSGCPRKMQISSQLLPAIMPSGGRDNPAIVQNYSASLHGDPEMSWLWFCVMIHPMLSPKPLLLATLFGASALLFPPAAMTATPSSPDDPFQNHGIVARVSERRGFMAVEDANGKKWVIGFIRDML